MTTMAHAKKRFWVHGANAVVSTIAAAGIAVVGYVLVDRFRPFRIDMTKAGTYSLSDKTIDILGRLDREVRVTFFLVPPSMSADAQFVNSRVGDLLEEYKVRSKGKVTYEAVNPLADALRVQELGGDLGAAVFASGDRKIVVQSKEIFETGFNYDEHGGTAFTGEEAFDSALLRLMEGTTNVACFLAGHGEYEIEAATDQGYSIAADLLKSENLESKAVRLDSAADAAPRERLALDGPATGSPGPAAGAEGTVEVPGDCSVLIVAGPRGLIRGPEVDAILRHVERGKGLVVLAEPLGTSGIEGLIGRLGVEALPGVAADFRQRLKTPLTVIPTFKRHEIVDPLELKGMAVVLPRAMGLKVPASPTEGPAAGAAGDTTVTPLFETSEESLLVVDIKDGQADPASPKNRPGPVTLGVAVEKKVGGKTARAVVIGDSDFASNANLKALAIGGGAGNVDLFKNAVNWAAGAREKIGIGPKDPGLTTVTMTDRGALWVLLSTGLVLPGGIFGVGMTIWIRRRRR